MANDKGSYFLGTTFSFLVGTAGGFILGVLFAPASGGETRRNIQEGVNKTGEKVKESYGRITKEAEKGIKAVKEKTQEGIESARKFMEKKKVEVMKMLPDKTAKGKKRKK